MAEQTIINNEDDETIEISTAEYEAIIGFSVKIAEQNALVMKSLETLRGEMVAQAETLTAIFGTFKDALAGLNIQVDVPQLAPPVINLPAPIVNVGAPAVTVKVPPEKKKKGKLTFRRDGDGRIASPLEWTVE